jgi:hypothetical protein
MAIIPSTAKVLNQYENVNTTYGGSKAMKAQSKWYTMQDVEDTIKPYKVFTALLTQSGGDNTVGVSGEEGIINIGVTYYISENPNNDDLTIYGAPNNEAGTYFIANQTGILNYTDSLLLTYNTGAPVATVLENTIGNIWFDYEDIGEYWLNSNGLFTTNKTILMQDQQFNRNDTDNRYFIRGVYVNPNVTIIATADSNDSGVNSVLYNTPIEIRVYN